MNECMNMLYFVFTNSILQTTDVFLSLRIPSLSFTLMLSKALFL